MSSGRRYSLEQLMVESGRIVSWYCRGQQNSTLGTQFVHPIHFTDWVPFYQQCAGRNACDILQSNWKHGTTLISAELISDRN